MAREVIKKLTAAELERLGPTVQKWVRMCKTCDPEERTEQVESMLGRGMSRACERLGADGFDPDTLAFYREVNS